MLGISANCNEARLLETDGRPDIQGNPTEGALVVAAAKAGISRDRLSAGEAEHLQTYPFDSTRKMMSVLARLPEGQTYLVAKGAPDVILARSGRILMNNKEVELTEDLRRQVEAVISDFGADPLRTLAIAYRPVEDGKLDVNDPE